MRLFATGVTLVSLLFLWAVPGSAAGSSSGVQPPPGVHVDSGSPAAKQYALPIPTARTELGGGSSSQGGGSQNPGASAPQNGPLFGRGITSPSTPASPRKRHPGRRSHRHDPRAHPKAAVPVPSVAIPASFSGTRPASGDGGNAWLALIGGGLLVLLLGGGGGLALRRRLR